MLSKRHQEVLKKEGIDHLCISGTEIATVDANQAYDLIGFTQAGISLPYYDLSSTLIGHRVKLDDKKEGLKYLTKKNASLHAFFIKNDISKILDIKVPLTIVEAEKKVLKTRITRPEDAVIGPPGAYGWSKNKKLAPIWVDIPMQGRLVNVVPDSDFFTNELVWRGWADFIKELINLGAIVNLVDIRGEDYEVRS